MKSFVNSSLVYAEIVAAFRRAQADAAHEFGLIQTVAKKCPAALPVAIKTMAKAAKRTTLGAIPKNCVTLSAAMPSCYLLRLAQHFPPAALL